MKLISYIVYCVLCFISASLITSFDIHVFDWQFWVMGLCVWGSFLCGGIVEKPTYHTSGIINFCKSEMRLDNQGNNPLTGGTEKYEKKYAYEIGYNMALQKVINNFR